ncbi:MAG: restriction endonuclease subunit S, partial [Proteobacteria bacterium]|nr:restriction endonuclease subunit S [Pseudomonadota bacterium]
NCDRVYSIKANLKTLVIPHPPMEEQVKIADALYTIDRLIDLSHRKIETLKELKKVLGHELFRGKKRFNKPETEKEGAIPPPDKSGGLLTHFL